MSTCDWPPSHQPEPPHLKHIRTIHTPPLVLSLPFPPLPSPFSPPLNPLPPLHPPSAPPSFSCPQPEVDTNLSLPSSLPCPAGISLAQRQVRAVRCSALLHWCSALLHWCSALLHWRSALLHWRSALLHWCSACVCVSQTLTE